MGRRMIDTGMWSNENFAQLPWEARLLQIGIINHADDQGRLKANPIYLRSLIFPYDDVKPAQVEEWLLLIEANSTVVRYEVDGKVYLQLPKWWEYQSLSFATASDYPKPPQWKDRIRYTAKGRNIYTCNWINANGEPLPDTCTEDGTPVPQGKPPAPPRQNKNGADSESHNEPHGQPYDEPHGQPPAPLNKLNRNEDKDKDKENASALPEPVALKVNGESRHHPDSSPDFAELCKRYENEFGMLSPHIADELSALLDEYKSTAMILDAFSVAVEANKRNMSYVKGCLRNWRSEGKHGKAQAPTPKTTLVMGKVLDNPFTIH